ncbi:MAG TPA: DnaJ domain-containing protein [Polyangia bacterium]
MRPNQDPGGGLSVAVCSVTTTKRRRFLWAAWWTAVPTVDPFRAPDAHSGGARTRDEAFAQAEQAARRPLTEIPSTWARAWTRVLEGRPPWVATKPTAAARASAGRAPVEASIWATLGVGPHATAAEVKRAYRTRALATHPDRGGNPEDFREVQRAFAEAQKRLLRRGPRPRR